VYAAFGIFSVVLSTLILPLPEELALLGAGIVAHTGATPLWAAWVAAWAGIVVGDTSSYLAGRWFLSPALRTGFGRRLVPPELQSWAEDLVSRQGVRAILLARFLVALRGPIYLAIGAARYPMLRFELINGAVGLFEVAILVCIGYFFGRSTTVEHRAVWLEISFAVFLASILIVPPIIKWRLLNRQRQQ
jgi:membrane protein DedA with SNARE-associated domain